MNPLRSPIPSAATTNIVAAVVRPVTLPAFTENYSGAQKTYALHEVKRVAEPWAAERVLDATARGQQVADLRGDEAGRTIERIDRGDALTESVREVVHGAVVPHRP